MAVKQPSQILSPEPEISLYYSLFLLLLSSFWMAWYSSPFLNWQVYLSFFFQQICLLCLYLCADILLRKKALQYILAGVAFLLSVLILMDSVVLSSLSTSFWEALPMILQGGSLKTMAMEMGFSTEEASLVFLMILCFFISGIFLYRRFPKKKISKKTFPKIGLAFAFCTLLFVGEQMHSRQTSEYMLREGTCPFYIQIFSTNAASHTISIPHPLSNQERDFYLSKIGKPKNPKNVILFVLESFNKSLVNPKICPHLFRLSKESLFLPEACSVAIFTSMVWHSFFMDRPNISYVSEIYSQREEDFRGSWPLEILDKSGYQIYLSLSTDFSWKNTQGRVLGNLKDKIAFYSAFQGDLEERHKADNRATQKFLSWFSAIDRKKPFFMMLQLDSTHWNYYFDPEAVIAKPYSPPLSPSAIFTVSEIKPVYNRYLNAARHVDNKIGEVLKALKDRGEYDNTVILLFSDHGESFAEGKFGHTTLGPSTKRIPLLMKFPGVPARDIPLMVSQEVIFPTLFDYLQIDGFERKMLRGASLLGKKKEKEKDLEILTINGTGRMGDLNLPSCTIRLRMSIQSSKVSFTPIFFLSHGEEKILEDPHFIHRIEWKKALEKNIQKK